MGTPSSPQHIAVSPGGKPLYKKGISIWTLPIWGEGGGGERCKRLFWQGVTQQRFVWDFLLNPEDEGPRSGAGQEATRSLKEPQVGKVERGSGRQCRPECASLFFPSSLSFHHRIKLKYYLHSYEDFIVRQVLILRSTLCLATVFIILESTALVTS